MCVAVISDIHSNLHALEAVLATIEMDAPDELWCLGDLVGYGPRPNECCEAVEARAVVCLGGNHDLTAVAPNVAVLTGLMVPQTSQNGFALGWDEVKLPNPLFEGDTLYADSEVLETRESTSRKGWGIVKVRQRGFKPDGTVVLVMTRSFMVPTRAAAPRREPPPPRD